MITLSLNAKVAIKIGLAMVLVYGIALQLDWMNPSWAGFTVALISLATVGESLHQGVQRLAGTIPGCIMALAILGLVPQDRWLFIVLVSMWVLFTSYLMQGKKNSYFWKVAGLTFLIITTTGPESSQSAFEHAMFRTLETAMGVVVYTFVTVFLWPRTNAGALKKTSRELLAAQATIFQSFRDQLLGRGSAQQAAKLKPQEISLIGQFAQELQAEGSESWEVKASWSWSPFRTNRPTTWPLRSIPTCSPLDAHCWCLRYPI